MSLFNALELARKQLFLLGRTNLGHLQVHLAGANLIIRTPLLA